MIRSSLKLPALWSTLTAMKLTFFQFTKKFHSVRTPRNNGLNIKRDKVLYDMIMYEFKWNFNSYLITKRPLSCRITMWFNKYSSDSCLRHTSRFAAILINIPRSNLSYVLVFIMSLFTLVLHFMHRVCSYKLDSPVAILNGYLCMYILPVSILSNTNRNINWQIINLYFSSFILHNTLTTSTIEHRSLR